MIQYIYKKYLTYYDIKYDEDRMIIYDMTVGRLVYDGEYTGCVIHDIFVNEKIKEYQEKIVNDRNNRIEIINNSVILPKIIKSGFKKVS